MSDLNYLDMNDARELVDRISDRTQNFDYRMSTNEKEAMAELLSDIGVNTSDLINVTNLADNYAINAEIVTPEEVDDYDKSSLQYSLFTWEEFGETYYCIQW